MHLYCTSKNSGPSWQSDPLRLIYIGTSVKDAEEAVGDFQKYSREDFPPPDRRKYYSALPEAAEREMIQFFMADGWWYSIEMFELDNEGNFVPSTYELVWDERSPNWSKDPEYCRFFLQAQQNYFNQKLHACGYVLLNEILEALGYDRTTLGAQIGWTALNEGFISFGLEDIDHFGDCTLTFNVQGVVYDQIDGINSLPRGMQ